MFSRALRKFQFFQVFKCSCFLNVFKTLIGTSLGMENFPVDLMGVLALCVQSVVPLLLGGLLSSVWIMFFHDTINLWFFIVLFHYMIL